MKRRIFATLLTLAMLLSMAVAPVCAESSLGDNLSGSGDACGCGCGKTFGEITWEVWTGELSSGHFYLEEDYAAPEMITVISGESVVLDLRGHTITTAIHCRLFYVSGYVGVLDTVGGGRVSAKCSNASAYNGGIVHVVDNETTGSAFELFSGTVTPAEDASKPKYGGLIYLGDGATFRMHDGVLLNGKTASDRSGGAIAAVVATATVDIRGGSIVGCSAGSHGGAIYTSAAVVKMENCRITGCSAGSSGGGIYLGGGSLAMNNCVLSGGISESTTRYGGGNLSVVSNATVQITDSVICGGYALSNGGNLSLGRGTTVLENTQVYGGTCEGMGSNISLPISTANVTLNGCTVDGGMDNVIGTLTLKGATKIALTNGGLDLGEQTKTTTATGLTEGAEVYISGAGKTLTGSLDYIKPALRTSISADGTTLTLAAATDREAAGYCPHCGGQVAWNAYGTEGATHTYLTADLAVFAELSVTDDLVIDLAGFDITATGRAFNVGAEAALTLMDSVGGGIVTGSGVEAENGGVITSAGTLKLYGGKYVYAAGSTVAGGGILYSAGALELHNVILDASAFENTAETAFGGAVWSADGSYTVTATGLRVLGGSAAYGGSAYFGYNNTVTLTASSFLDGKAANGGNIAAIGTSSEAAGSITLNQVALRDGEATGTYGGNMHTVYYLGTVTESYFEGGVSASYSGNISTGSGKGITCTDCIFEGSSAGNKGGQAYLAANTSQLTLVDCLMTNGSAPKGGNIYANSGYLTVKGGEISYGEATSDSGGNIYSSTGKMTVLDVNENGVAPLVCRGTAAVRGGNIIAGDNAELNAVKLANGYAADCGNDLYIYGTSSVIALGAGVTGNILMNASDSLLTDEVYGGAISCVTCSQSDASFYLDGTYGNCGLTVKDGLMYVAVAAVVDGAGNATWFSSNADAVEACGEGSYVKLFTDEELVLTKDLYADLNGNTVNVSGDYVFYGMDASGDDFSVATGKAILACADAPGTVTAPNGNTYVAIDSGEGVSYHRLDMRITGVNIRPSVDGVYYSAKWACDETLQGIIDSYGIAASLADMPGADFADDGDTLYTVMGKETFRNGAVQNGAVLSGILKTERTEEENEACGRMPIYAKAYIVLTDGTTLVSNDNVQPSLYALMKSLDKLIMERPLQYRKYNLAARNFYEKWQDGGMGDWALTKIPKPEDDGVINVLMIGSSFCYYYVQELYALGQAAGIDIRVCNLYYSGCPLEKHYNWWANEKSNYQYYETFHDGRNLTSNVSLEWGLAQHEWDFISLQESSSATVEDGAQVHFDDTKQYWEPLLDYLIAQFPDAQVGWHQTWTYQVEHGKEGTTMTSEIQSTNTGIMEEYATLICDYYNEDQEKTLVRRIPSGRAWQNTRDNGYDFLCCRLGKTNPVTGVAHAGDGYHDGDIGGGQYLNACVWFEIVTGKSVIGNTYKPDYATTSTLSDSLLSQLMVEKTETGYALTDELITLLQQAAHEAVASTGFTVE